MDQFENLCERGDLEAVMHLALNPDYNLAKMEAFKKAMKSGNPKLVKYLLDQGCVVKEHILDLSLYCSLEMTMLVEQHMDPDYKKCSLKLSWGCTGLDPSLESLEYLRSCGYRLEDSRMIPHAFHTYNIDVLNCIISMGHPVSKNVLSGLEHLELTEHDVELEQTFIKILIEHGANPTVSEEYDRPRVDCKKLNLAARTSSDATKAFLNLVDYHMCDLNTHVNKVGKIGVCDLDTYIYLTDKGLNSENIVIDFRVTCDLMDELNEKGILGKECFANSILTCGTLDEVKYFYSFDINHHTSEELFKNRCMKVVDYVVKLEKYELTYCNLIAILGSTWDFQNDRYWDIHLYILMNSNCDRSIQTIMSYTRDIRAFKYVNSIGYKYKNCLNNQWTASEEIALYTLEVFGTPPKNILASVCKFSIPTIQKFIDAGCEPICDNATAACCKDIDKVKFMISLGNNINTPVFIERAIDKIYDVGDLRVLHRLGCSFVDQIVFNSLYYNVFWFSYDFINFMIEVGNGPVTEENIIDICGEISMMSFVDALKIIDLFKDHMVNNKIFAIVCGESIHSSSLILIKRMIELGNDISTLGPEDYETIAECWYKVYRKNLNGPTLEYILSSIEDPIIINTMLEYLEDLPIVTTTDFYHRNEFNVIYGEVYVSKHGDSGKKEEYYDQYIADTSHLTRKVKRAR